MKCFVNVGIYVLEPRVLDFIPRNTHMDMPHLITHLIQEKMPVAAFPLREFWADIGRVEDLEKANRE